MANGVFNIAKGRVNELFSRVAGNDPANSALVLVLLRVAQADTTLQDYDTLADILAAANTEANFTNYARKTLTDSAVTAPAPDDTNNWQGCTIANQTWTSAGGAVNNALVKLLVCYDPDTTGGTDANLIPLLHYDFAATTDGNNLVAQINASGLYRAS